MSIIESAGPQLNRVERFTLEVIADECAPLYEGQLQCSAVVAAAARLGFAPVLPIACRLPPSLRFPALPGKRTNHKFCELDVLFVREGVRADAEPAFLEYHDIGPHVCTEAYDSDEHSWRWRTTASAPAGKIMVGMHHPGGGTFFLGEPYPMRTEGRWRVGQKASRRHAIAPVASVASVRAVTCPASCFRAPEDAAREDVKQNLTKYGGRCPW